MILFQIHATDRQFMQKYLTQYFGLEYFMKSENISRLTLRDLSENVVALEDLFYNIIDSLSKCFPRVFSLGKEFLESDAARKAFFWDTIIALYCQLKYSESKRISIREFYNSNLSRYGVKYNSYTGYFKKFIFSQPVGEFIGIRPLHAVSEKTVAHPKRLIMDCFPLQQYALIHSYRKSPYCGEGHAEIKKSKNIRFDALEFSKYLLPQTYDVRKYYMISENYQEYKSMIQKMIDIGSNSYATTHCHSITFDQQLTDYIMEQFYNYNTYSVAASEEKIVAPYRAMEQEYRRLHSEISEAVDQLLKTNLFSDDDSPSIEDRQSADIAKRIEAVNNLPYAQQLTKLSEEYNAVFDVLNTMASIAQISAVLFRPHIIYKLPMTEKQFIEQYGYRFEVEEGFGPIPYLANVYIPLVQEFFLQVLLQHFQNSSNTNLIYRLTQSLDQLLQNNTERWAIKNVVSSFEIKSKGLRQSAKDVLGIMFELGRQQYRSVEAIQQEQIKLNYNRFTEPYYFHTCLLPAIQKELSCL